MTTFIKVNSDEETNIDKYWMAAHKIPQIPKITLTDKLSEWNKAKIVLNGQKSFIKEPKT